MAASPKPSHRRKAKASRCRARSAGPARGLRPRRALRRGPVTLAAELGHALTRTVPGAGPWAVSWPPGTPGPRLPPPTWPFTAHSASPRYCVAMRGDTQASRPTTASERGQGMTDWVTTVADLGTAEVPRCSRWRPSSPPARPTPRPAAPNAACSTDCARSCSLALGGPGPEGHLHRPEVDARARGTRRARDRRRGGLPGGVLAQRGPRRGRAARLGPGRRRVRARTATRRTSTG